MRELPIIAVNGILGAQISPVDRGFNYGDGVFETCKLINGKLRLWEMHRARLLLGCAKLFIPINEVLIESFVNQMMDVCANAEIEQAVVKITITRGEGGRGYAWPELTSPTVVIGIFPAAQYPKQNALCGIRVRLCETKLGANSQLAGIKHLNRLEQILARSEWQAPEFAEGIVCDQFDNVIEGTFSNLFIVKENKIKTPRLDLSGVAGVMRQFIIERVTTELSHSIEITNISRAELFGADEIFMCNSLYGIWPVKEIVADKMYNYQVGNITKSIQNKLDELLGF